MFLIIVIVIGNITYGIFQLSKLISPYIKFLFPDIKSHIEIEDFYIDNEKQIQKLINTLNKLPYKTISIYNWVILQDETIDADGKEVSLDDAFDNKQIVLDILKKDVKYIEKHNNVIYIVTDTATDYSQGIAWLREKTSDLFMRYTDNVYYIKQLSDDFWIFEVRD